VSGGKFLPAEEHYVFDLRREEKKKEQRSFETISPRYYRNLQKKGEKGCTSPPGGKSS